MTPLKIILDGAGVDSAIGSTELAALLQLDRVQSTVQNQTLVLGGEAADLERVRQACEEGRFDQTLAPHRLSVLEVWHDRRCLYERLPTIDLQCPPLENIGIEDMQAELIEIG